MIYGEIEKFMILYRPVTLQVLALIYDSGMKAFPTRLPKQPIFYPVLQLEYARKTASDWNVKNGEFAGYVTQFTVQDKYIKKFEKHQVGKSQFQELWIPEDKMEEFNKHIAGHIKVLEAHFGNAFQGFVPDQFDLQGKNAVEQFTVLTNAYLYKRVNFFREIRRSHKAIFLNFPFWQKYEFKNPGLKEKIVQAIKEAWLTSFPQIPLPLPVKEDLPLEDQAEAKSTSKNEDKPIKGEVLTKEEADDYAYSWEDPAEVETPTPRQTYANTLIDPDEEELASEEQTDVDPYADAQRLASFVHEKFPPLKQTYADVPHLPDPFQEDTSAVQQSDSNAKQINPVRKISEPSPQIDSLSAFDQGIKLGLSGKYQEAIDELSKAIEKDSRDVNAHVSLGVAYHRIGEAERALDFYETALKIDPIYAEAHYFRANILYEHGNVRDAIAGYTVAISLNPELIEAHQKPAPENRLTDYTGLPAEMVRIAKPARRILDLTRSLERNPRQSPLLKERAAEYYRLRNYVQAIADYSSSLELQPEDASAHHARGIAYEKLGQNDRAAEDFKRALAINPQLPDTYIKRGIELGQAGNFRQSIANLTEGIRLAPKNPNAYFNRGMTYFQQGEFEKAIPDFSMTIQLASNDEDAYYFRGLSYEAAGHQQEAIVDYKHFLALSQNQEAKIEIEQRLNQWQGARQEQADNDISQDLLLAKLGRWVGRLGGVSNKRQKTDEVPSAVGQEPTFDLYALITVLGDRSLNSIWLASGVECYGESADELFALSEQRQPIKGEDFVSIASSIRQTIRGDFQAFEPDINTPWIFIRAWDGNGFYIETDDAQVEQQLKTHFPGIEEVEGAQPPYAALFLPI